MTENLSELILRRKNELGLSYEKLADRARERGHQIRASSLYQLANRGIQQHPTPAILLGVEAAIDVPMGTILDAIEVQLGLSRETVDLGDESLQAWLILTGDRTPEQRAALVEKLRELVDEAPAGGAASVDRRDPDSR